MISIYKAILKDYPASPDDPVVNLLFGEYIEKIKAEAYAQGKAEGIANASPKSYIPASSPRKKSPRSWKCLWNKCWRSGMGRSCLNCDFLIIMIFLAPVGADGIREADSGLAV